MGDGTENASIEERNVAPRRDIWSAVILNEAWARELRDILNNIGNPRTSVISIINDPFEELRAWIYH